MLAWRGKKKKEERGREREMEEGLHRRVEN
jgi:hypothetical protein